MRKQILKIADPVNLVCCKLRFELRFGHRKLKIGYCKLKLDTSKIRFQPGKQTFGRCKLGF